MPSPGGESPSGAAATPGYQPGVLVDLPYSKLPFWINSPADAVAERIANKPAKTINCRKKYMAMLHNTEKPKLFALAEHPSTTYLIVSAVPLN